MNLFLSLKSNIESCVRKLAPLANLTLRSHNDTQIVIHFWDTLTSFEDYQEIKLSQSLEILDHCRHSILKGNAKKIKVIAPKMRPRKCFGPLTRVGH